jgi:hypothetical protein
MPDGSALVESGQAGWLGVSDLALPCSFTVDFILSHRVSHKLAGVCVAVGAHNHAGDAAKVELAAVTSSSTVVGKPNLYLQLVLELDGKD